MAREASAWGEKMAKEASAAADKAGELTIERMLDEFVVRARAPRPTTRCPQIPTALGALVPGHSQCAVHR